MSESFDLPDLDHFGAVAVGPPGQRVFYLQARQGERVVCLRAEKQHVAALAQHFAVFLVDLPQVADVPDAGEPLGPLEPVWVAGNVALAYDEDADRVMVEIEELAEEGTARATARLGLSRAQAAAFARDGAALVVAGRPACRLCGHPMDPEGHVCPRANGHSRPAS